LVIRLRPGSWWDRLCMVGVCGILEEYKYSHIHAIYCMPPPKKTNRPKLQDPNPKTIRPLNKNRGPARSPPTVYPKPSSIIRSAVLRQALQIKSPGICYHTCIKSLENSVLSEMVENERWPEYHYDSEPNPLRENTLPHKAQPSRALCELHTKNPIQKNQMNFAAGDIL